MGYHKVMGFHCLPSPWTAKSYGLLQSMGYRSYGLRQSWLYHSHTPEPGPTTARPRDFIAQLNAIDKRINGLQQEQVQDVVDLGTIERRMADDLVSTVFDNGGGTGDGVEAEGSA